MIDKIKQILVIICTCFAMPVQGQQAVQLSNPNSSIEARALFSYLNDMYGKKILSGQMWASWGYDELKYIQRVTGNWYKKSEKGRPWATKPKQHHFCQWWK